MRGRETEYDEVIRSWSEDAEAFWLDMAKGVDWHTPPTRALDESRAPIYRWFPDGELNVCQNALDRHVAAGHGDRTALIYDSPVTRTVERYSYADLLTHVARFAGVLRDHGVGTGDRVVIYMPMIPQAVIAMLACARLGAVHSVVFGGFAAAELAVRIDDTAPKVIVSASCGIERDRIVEYKPLLDAALQQSSLAPETVIVVQRSQHRCALIDGRDLDYDALMADPGLAPAEPVPVKATDPLYVLYTSGTTGRPKGIVRDAGGHAVTLTWSIPHLFGLGPEDTIFTASDVGWVVGHSYIVYAPLLAGITSVLYEGKPIGTPDAGAFWRVVAQHGVNVLFTAPTAMRVIRKEDPHGKLLGEHSLASLNAVFLAGERLDPDTWEWTTARLAEATGRDVPVVDNWWQTETGWPIAANPLGLHRFPAKPGSPTLPVPGYDVRVLQADGTEAPRGTEGAVAIRLPMPPGTLATVWGDDDRFVSSYLSTFPGYYLTGDGGMIDEDGYVYVLGRTDDVINVAGHRLSTGALEAAIASHPAVAECAVIGVKDEVKGQTPRALVVVGDAAEVDRDELRRELVALVRAEVGPVAALKQVDIVAALPKTRSGKILRKTMRQIADAQEAPVPSTIEDPAVLDTVARVLRPQGP
ncbi:acetate--CoA ligase [Sediminivirga luteola]|uniref:acetate--CoA ligase n=1 Tax=Sediminivirga luteola TaxID=1774748 RepID=UPI001F56B5FC|nr:acetate--CoA ligase [Sediminivirga luteola]MCI2266840.1 acetate--CoA ligase [Sediminivirga luteola]